MLRAHLVMIALCFSSIALTATARAASDANALWQATEAKLIAQEYVKEMIIGWKKNKAAEVRAEFNILTMRDSSGRETLRMTPVQNESGKFLINGVFWTLPQNGSISQSLKTAKTQGIDGAYLYSSLLHSKGSARKNLWASLTRQPIEVHCSADRASGRVKISKHVLKFTAATDGSVVLAAMLPHTGMPFRVKNESGVLVFTSCIDARCDETSGVTKTSIKSFLKLPDPEDVDIANTFRPRDSHDGKYPIEFACEDESDCDRMEIDGLEKMSPRDKEWAIKFRDRANASLVKAKADTAQIIRSLEPLAACCQESACSQAVALNKINLVQTETIRSARTGK